VFGRVLKYAVRKKAIQTNPLDHTEVEGGYANGDDDGFTRTRSRQSRSARSRNGTRCTAW